jgi:hypothetical protein
MVSRVVYRGVSHKTPFPNKFSMRAGQVLQGIGTKSILRNRPISSTFLLQIIIQPTLYVRDQGV